MKKNLPKRKPAKTPNWKNRTKSKKRLAGPTIKALMQRCDHLWAKAVKLRAKGVCEWCGKPAIDSHHMVSRARSRMLRHDLRNGVALCKGCHMEFHNRQSLSGWKNFERQRPKDFAYVSEVMRMVAHFRRSDVLDTIDRLEEIVRQEQDGDL